MDENQIKIMVDSLVDASKLGTVNALTYIKTGFETYKKVEIRNDCKSKEVQIFVEFMIIYLNEAIKTLDKKNEVEENE